MAVTTRLFDINVNQIHTDITNILFEGSYENSEDEQLQITYGHTKKGQDSRCKQVNFSLSVSADSGVPIWYDSLDGQTNDSICYLPHLDALSNELGVTSPLVVGDSKLVSNNNMIAFLKAGAFFIGPATLDEKGKKRIIKLWEQGVCFSALPLNANGMSFRMERRDEIAHALWGIAEFYKLYAGNPTLHNKSANRRLLLEKALEYAEESHRIYAFLGGSKRC